MLPDLSSSRVEHTMGHILHTNFTFKTTRNKQMVVHYTERRSPAKSPIRYIKRKNSANQTPLYNIFILPR